MRFSELHPLAYYAAVGCFRTRRRLAWILSRARWARERSREELPFETMRHSTPLYRKLDGVPEELQRNKVRNLELAIRRLSGIVIRPGEEFSFWMAAGPNSRARGYLPGLVLRHGGTASGIGGGICQMANMIHWMVLHSPLEVTERHHHSADFFPDNLRRVPFGSGASVFYNYVDYRFRNPTSASFQLVFALTPTHLEGRLLQDREPEFRYEVIEPLHRFLKFAGEYYRENTIARRKLKASDGSLVSEEELYHHCSKVLYDPSFIPAFEEVDRLPQTGRP